MFPFEKKPSTLDKCLVCTLRQEVIMGTKINVKRKKTNRLYLDNKQCTLLVCKLLPRRPR